MADEVNQFAHEGGDTEPETAAAIKARNEASDAMAEETRKHNEALAAARQEHADKMAELEAKAMEETPEILTGAPVVTESQKPNKGTRSGQRAGTTQ